MLSKAIFFTCLFLSLLGQAQTGRYWLLGAEQSIHFNPNPTLTNRFITSIIRKPCNNNPYNICKADNPFFPVLYSDCNDSLCLYIVLDSIFSYNRIRIGWIWKFTHSFYDINPGLLIPVPLKNNQFGLIGAFHDSGFNSNGYIWKMHYSQFYYDRISNNGFVYNNKKLIYLKQQVGSNQNIHNLNWAPNEDGVNLWVLTLKNDSTFLSYPFDSSGIVLKPVESPIKGNLEEGNIRPSHDYKHIVVSGVTPQKSKTYSTWLYDFDVSTGKVSNGRGILKHSEHSGTLSKAIEFSPKDSFIYISTLTDTLLYAPRLIQHNIYTGENILLATFPNMKPDNQWRLYSLQLAPDGKIYGTYIDYGYTVDNFNGNYLACIQYPDRPGMSCRFKKDCIFFKYGLSLGLPNNYCYPTVMDAYINPKYKCNDTTVIRIDAKWFNRLQINWGDGDSIVYDNREWLDKPDQKHYYKKPGKYLISLSGFMPPCNTFHQWQDSIVVLKNPISKGYTLTKDTLCQAMKVSLKDTTQKAYMLKVNWGDGVDSSFSSIINNSHYYYTQTPYTITYSIHGKDTLGEKGCKLEFEQAVNPFYFNKVEASFTINDSVQCLNKNSFDFINTSPDTANITSFWDLGEQTLYSKTNIIGKKYSKDSLFKITLFTETKNGCKDTAKAQITILPAPQADFSTGITCSKTKTDFIFTGKKLTNTTFEWNFDNESKAYSENASYMFSNAGNKKVKLIVKADNNCNDTIEKTIEIKKQAKAEFETKDVCENDSAVFINKSKDADEYLWKFGDGQYSKLKETRHKYQIPKTTTFLVTLVAKSGCSDSVTNPITVNQNPNSDFTSTQNGDKLTLKAQSGYSNYKWKFNDKDSITVTSENYIHTLSNYTPIKICLQITDINNCTSQTCKTIPLGIKQTFKPQTFKLYPNPNSGTFTIESENPNHLTIQIFDVLGREVSFTKQPNLQTSNLQTIKLTANETRGIYFVKLKQNGVTWVERVLVGGN